MAIPATKPRITSVRHPEYGLDYSKYLKWRLAYKGGEEFRDHYLKTFSKRETPADFATRKDISYSPAFAKSGINDIKNAIYQRMGEIKRLEGPDSYKKAVAGEGGGVDLEGSAMDTFIGQFILPEMLSMRKVGVYVDRKPLAGQLKSQNVNNSPYLYFYRAEDILSWKIDYNEGEFIFRSLLLRDTAVTSDNEWGLPSSVEETYRFLYISPESGNVIVQIYVVGEEVDELRSTTELGIKRIPFVPFELKESLLEDAADIQIGLLNLSSADLNYCHKGNVPFYVEQYDAPSEAAQARQQQIISEATVDGRIVTREVARDPTEIDFGVVHGRRYPRGSNEPNFIAPPAEPLLASMKKQEQMKGEIRQLINLAATNAEPIHASADSKAMDDRSLESGLSYIGLELEWGEREIAKIWSLYTGDKPAQVTYPKKYSLKTDSDRQEEAKNLKELKNAVPSPIFAREVGKEIARTMLHGKVPHETLLAIEREIDKANYVLSVPDDVKIAVELGLVTEETASNALGFDGEKEVPKARDQHAERLARIAESQAKGAARGVPDQSVNKGSVDAVGEKTASQKSTDTEPNPAKDKTRGAAA
jgi:hypothetical protein